MSGPPAFISPPVLRWARESAGYDLEGAARGLGVAKRKLQAAEEGGANLTLRQAERAAAVYERPLAALFLPSPPDEDPQEAQFRRLPGAPIPPWPPAMAKLARRVRERQAASAELLEMLEEPPNWPQARDLLTVPRAEAANRARETLGIGLAEQMEWLDRDGYTPLRRWIDAVEGLGILVMHDGSLEFDRMRGFTSLHPEVPAIVVNTNDDPRARVFTLIHELGHLYFAAVGSEQTDEEWLEAFAGQVLMPSAKLAVLLDDSDEQDGVRRIDQVALQFGVTPRALLTRATREGLISTEEAGPLFRQIRERGRKSRGSGGGNYYRNELGRLGPAYSRLVFTALERQAVTYAAASDLLGIKVNNFDKFRTYLDERAAPA